MRESIKGLHTQLFSIEDFPHLGFLVTRAEYIKKYNLSQVEFSVLGDGDVDTEIYQNTLILRGKVTAEKALDLMALDFMKDQFDKMVKTGKYKP